MMPRISEKQYLLRKVNASHFFETDTFYLNIANSLCQSWDQNPSFPELSVEMKQEVALNVIGYLMDIVADLGLWRAFTTHCRKLYGTPVPFFQDSDYIDYELNLADVRFMIWYSICFVSDPGNDPVFPFDERILNLSESWFNILEASYDEAPRPEGMLKTNDLEMHDPDDADTIQQLGYWLFWSSYLAVPCFKSNMAMIYQQAKPDDRQGLHQLMGQAQMELPTGPLALYLREWIWLILTDKLPPRPRYEKQPDEHPYYQAFLDANNGSRIAFFRDYKEMNIFLGKALGWDPDADNLPQLRDAYDFTLLTNPHKGLLIGRNVARCIAHPDNKFYDPVYAAENDFKMLVQRGNCPIDLTLFCLENQLLPDLLWTGVANSREVTVKNADFIARCFLLQYYRAI